MLVLAEMKPDWKEVLGESWQEVSASGCSVCRLLKVRNVTAGRLIVDISL